MRTIAMLVLVSIALVCTFVFIWRHYRRQRPRRNGLNLRKPPNTLPILGNGILFLRDRHSLFDWFCACERKFGQETFEISVPTLPPGVVIGDPKNVEYVLKHEAIFTKGTFFKKRSWDLFGHGIINADGRLWRIQRRAGMQFFSVANLKVMVESEMPLLMQGVLSKLEEKAFIPGSIHPKSKIDLEYIFSDFSCRLMARFAYNLDFDASHPFCKAFDYASACTAQRFKNPIWKLNEWLFGSEFRRSIAIVKDFGRQVARSASSQPSCSSKGESRDNFVESPRVGGRLIDMLLDHLDNIDIAADAALNFLSAGKDTVSQALTWTFYLLFRHRRTLNLVRIELERQLQTISSDALRIDFETLQPTVLPYTYAVFYESLRLYPPVPFEMKQCQVAANLPDGTFLPRDTVVVWCAWAMGRSENIWPCEESSDAEREHSAPTKFYPERWLDTGPEDGLSDAYHLKHPMKSTAEFPVFHGGPRACLGKKMAELQAIFVIASLVTKFDFDEGMCGEPGCFTANERRTGESLTLPMQNGLPVHVHLRNP